MTEPVLNAARVMSSVGERIAAAVSQHVGVDARQAGARADRLIREALDDLVDTMRHSYARSVDDYVIKDGSAIYF